MIRILIVSPVRLLSDLIQAVCANDTDLVIVGWVRGKKEALAFKSRCDVILASAGLPGGEALTLVHALSKDSQSPAVLVIGLPNAEALVLRYLEAGAAGCIREQDSAEELIRAIHSAAARQVALSADLFPIVVRRVSALAQTNANERVPIAAAFDKSLTRREHEILGLIAQGYGNREIAQQLTIEVGTTKNHVHNILDKLHVKSRQDAAVYFSLGLV